MSRENTKAVSPLRADECEDTIKRLTSGELDPQTVHERIVEAVKDKRLWGTKEWKELRARAIKDACDQCGKTEPPMTLQHLWHPETVTDIAHGLRHNHKQEALQAFVAEHSSDPRFQDRMVAHGKLRAGCPKCGGWVVSERKNPEMKRYICRTIRAHRSCLHEFDEAPVIQPIKVESGWPRLRAAFEVHYQPIYHATSADILRSAAITAVQQFRLYLSEEGTATFCKTCAYMWDEKGLRLCQTCRDSWHEHFWQQCKACATGHKWVLCRACQKMRHLDKYERCYNCYLATPFGTDP